MTPTEALAAALRPSLRSIGPVTEADAIRTAYETAGRLAASGYEVRAKGEGLREALAVLHDDAFDQKRGAYWRYGVRHALTLIERALANEKTPPVAESLPDVGPELTARPNTLIGWHRPTLQPYPSGNEDSSTPVKPRAALAADAGAGKADTYGRCIHGVHPDRDCARCGEGQP